MRKLVGIVAGEASGDLIGSHLIRMLKKQRPDLDFVGIAGPKMIAEGAESLYPISKLSLHGYGIDVLKEIPSLLGVRRALVSYFKRVQPSIFIGIDAPDFNFSLESKLKESGIKTIHYVSPSIWAWRKGRMSKIKRSVSHMLALFPFELALYEAAKVPVTYVGHPLADIIPIKVDTKSAREALRLEKHSMVVAMLPGSRVGEVSRLAELFVETTFQISKQRKDALFLVPLITRETKDIFEKVLFDRIASLDESEVTPNVRIMFGHSHLAMQAADVVIVASGTATLEAALLKKPMVITYKMPWFSWQILKRLNYLPYVGLPNILASRFVVPELLQKDANPEKLSSTVLEMMADKSRVKEIVIEFTNIHHLLRQNTEEKAVQVILSYL
jgi:lipid-A-disaccharide synthase